MLIHRRHRVQRGVSLIELVTVLVVLSIAAFMAVPDIVSAISNARIRSSAESMLSGLQRARAEAMRNNLPVTFWMMSHNADRVLDASCAPSATSLSWIVSRADPAGSCDADISETTAPQIRVRHSAGDSSAAVTALGTEADRATASPNVTFNGYGRIAGGTLRFVDINSATPSNDTRPLRIEMTASGVIRLCEPRLPAAGTDSRRCLYS